MEYHKWMIAVVLLLGLFNTGFTKPSAGGDSYDDQNYDEIQGDDDYSYDDNEEVNPVPTNETVVLDPPYFADTSMQRIAVNEGDSAILHCDVINFNNKNLILWYKDNHLIVQMQNVMNKDKFELIDIFRIELKNADISDSGKYSCQVLPEKIMQNITLDVISKPSVIITSYGVDTTNKSLTYQQGERVELHCRALGVPNATIKWYKGGHRLHTHDTRIVEYGRIVIERIDSHDAGIYQCLGDDRSEHPAHVTVTLNVLHPPKVSTHRHFVNTEKGDTAELYCNYHAQPLGVTNWRKDGQYLPVDATKYKIQNAQHKEHNTTILFVSGIEEKDLGDYECEVSNKLGKEHATVHITYDPEIPQFEKLEPSDDKISLFWLVRSKQSLVEAILDYKLNESRVWMNQSPIDKPALEKTGVWKIRHDLKLEPGTWHARIKVKNSAGWSKFSHEHTFTVNDAFDNSIPEDVVYTADISSPFKSKTNAGNANFLSLRLLGVLSLIFIVPSVRFL